MSKSLFKKFSSKARGAFGAPKPARRQRTRLGVESLESRQLFSTAIVGGDGISRFTDRTILGQAPFQDTTAGISKGTIYGLTGDTIQVQATNDADTFGVLFVDADNSAVLVEFTGKGLVTVSLDTTLPSFSGPGSATNPAPLVAKGLAAISVDGATAGSSIRISEFDNPFGATNGLADVRSLSFTDTPSFSRILAAGASFAANAGSVGILAGNTNVTTQVRVGDINAGGTATASLAFGSGSSFANVEVYGGDLLNDNGSGILVEPANANDGLGGIFGGSFVGYNYGIQGLSAAITNDGDPAAGRAGQVTIRTADPNILQATFINALGQTVGGPGTGNFQASLPDSTPNFTITDDTTQQQVDSFFNGKTFNSNFILDVNTTDGTTHGLIIGDGNTAFDGSLTVTLDAASAATVGSFDGGLQVARLGNVTFGASGREFDLDSAITTPFNGRVGNVVINGNVDAFGGILGGGGIAGILVTGDVTGATPSFGAKFETLGRVNGLAADIGQVTINGDVALLEIGGGLVFGDGTDALINVAAGAGIGTLRGLTVAGGGTVAGDHYIGEILITNDSNIVAGAISITDDATLIFEGVQVINGPVRAGVTGGALLGPIAVTSTGVASDLILDGIIGADNAAAVGGTASAIGSVTLVAGRDLFIDAPIGTNISTFTGATSTDGAAGAAPLSGLILNAGRDITDTIAEGVSLFGSLTSLPSVGVSAGRDIDLIGDLGASASSFGKLYFSAGRDVVNLPATLQNVAATQRGTTDTVITAGDDVDLSNFAPGVLGGTIYNNITVTTGNVGETDVNGAGAAAPTGGDIIVGNGAVFGAQAGVITFNVDSTGANLGTITFPTEAIHFTGAVSGVVVNAAGVIDFEGGGNVIAGSLGVLSLGDTSNHADIVFTDTEDTTAQTAFVLVDDGTVAIDSISQITLRGFVTGSAASDFEIQAGLVGDIAISTDLTGKVADPALTAITNFGVLANNYRATADNVNAYGGTGETLGTITAAGTSTASKISQYTIGSVTINASGATVPAGSTVFGGQNSFVGLGGIRDTATGLGVSINSGSNATTLFAGGADAFFVAGNGSNDVRTAGAAAYSIGGDTLGDATIVAGATRVRVAIGDINVTAAGDEPSNILGLSGTDGGAGLAILSAVQVAADGAPINNTTPGAALTTTQAPVDDLDSSLNNPLIEGTIGNVNLRTLASGNTNGGLLPVSDQTPRPITDFSTSATSQPVLGIISATTSIGTVQNIASLTFPQTLNGNSSVQVGLDNVAGTTPRTLDSDSILIYLV